MALCSANRDRQIEAGQFSRYWGEDGNSLLRDRDVAVHPVLIRAGVEKTVFENGHEVRTLGLDCIVHGYRARDSALAARDGWA